MLSLRETDEHYRSANKIATPCDLGKLCSLYREGRAQGMRIGEANIYAVLKAYEG